MAVVSLLVTIPAVGGFLQAQWSWQVFAQAMAVALVLGVIGGIYPAWRASQLAPAEALRYE
jgi:putative ABC transport system permease protein